MMIGHDGNVGTVLAKLDELGLTENTIVMYGTDNGPHANTWPDGATTPFRSKKDTLGRCASSSLHDSMAGQDQGANRVERDRRPPRLEADAARRDRNAGIKERLPAGYTVGDRTFKVHLDGYNLLPYLTGQEAKSPRLGFIYFSDDGDLMARRFDNRKMVFLQHRSPGTLALWGEPFVNTRIP